MRGSGPYAEMIEKRFQLAIKKLGLAHKVPKLNCADFLHPRKKSAQMDLFDGKHPAFSVSFARLSATASAACSRFWCIAIRSIRSGCKRTNFINDFLKLGAAPLCVFSNAFRIAVRCAGMVPQHPPIIFAPALRAMTAYSAIKSGVPL